MYLAKNKNNKRVYIDNIINTDYKNKVFYCPICEGELIVKNGDINIAHFAHKSLKDCDSFTPDMSEWHKSWQCKFPEENREVIIEYNGKKHRADVCINDCVIEFQHSPISYKEFNERCEFYTDAGYTLFWVFDHIKDIEEYDDIKHMYNNGSISICDTSDKVRSFFTGEYTLYAGSIYKWKNAPKFMRDLIPQNKKDVFICFDFGWGIEKVNWTKTICELDEFDYTYTNKADYKFFSTDCSTDYGDFVKYFKNRDRNNICPDCGYPLVTRNGKYGSFTGCSNYPHCKYTKKREVK